MSRHDDTVSFRQMLEHATEAVAITQDRTRADLDSDRQFSLAVLKLVEIVGEAGNRVSASTRSANPQVPWGKIIATRNRLIHGYDTIDHVVLWDIITLDLPPLIAQLETIVGQ